MKHLSASVPTSLAIPKRAVMHGAQGAFVWVIGAGEQVTPTPVKLGVSAGNDVVVASGLAAGNRVVVDGLLKVQPGAPVHATMLGADGTPQAGAPQPGSPQAATPQPGAVQASPAAGGQ